MSKHEQFEEMCALAALGELSREGREELKEHLRECTLCRASLDQFSAVLNELPGIEEEFSRSAPKALRKDSGYRERFLERARGEGILFSDQAGGGVRSNRFSWRWPDRVMGWPAVAMGALALAAFSIGHQAYTAVQRESAHSAIQPGKGTEGTPVSKVFTKPHQVGTNRESDIQSLHADLTSAVNENAELHKRIAILEEHERSNRKQVAGLTGQLEQAGAVNTRLARESSERQLKLTSLQSEVAELESEHTKTNTLLAEQQNQVNDLAQQLKSAREALTRREEMLAQGRDVRELMGARNLHIIDLYDADGRGRNQKTFGRVFYTEGKSLIFYAFDLDEAKLANAGFTYQAWGEREGQQGSVKRLGMLYVDDHAQKRWVLKVENPERLAEIDSVFVTLERSGENKQPHGQKLLYAYLRSNANHP